MHNMNATYLLSLPIEYIASIYYNSQCQEGKARKTKRAPAGGPGRKGGRHDLGELTMTDILEGVAVSNAGNWVMSDEGKLLLLRYGDIPPETHYLVTEYGDAITFGGVRILVG